MHDQSLDLGQTGRASRGARRARRATALGATAAASLAMMGATLALTAATGATASADGTTTTTATSVPVTVPANFVGPHRLQHIKAVAAGAIARRVSILGSAVKTAQNLTYLGSNQATLVANTQADISGLQALGTKIAGDTTVAQAIADYRQVFTSYRVYYLVLPVAKLVERADRDDNVAVPNVQAEVTKLQGELTSSTPARVVRLVAGAQSELTKATTATNGLAAELLSYTAADWDANHNLLATPRGGVSSAERDLSTARDDVASAERYLRRHPHHGRPTTTTTSTIPPTTTSSTAPPTTTTVG